MYDSNSECTPAKRAKGKDTGFIEERLVKRGNERNFTEPGSLVLDFCYRNSSKNSEKVYAKKINHLRLTQGSFLEYEAFEFRDLLYELEHWYSDHRVRIIVL